MQSSFGLAGFSACSGCQEKLRDSPTLSPRLKLGEGCLNPRTLFFSGKSDACRSLFLHSKSGFPRTLVHKKTLEGRVVTGSQGGWVAMRVFQVRPRSWLVVITTPFQVVKVTNE